MKRSRKLPPEKRQKVSTACDGCKKRKFKCTGTNPCKLCLKKGIECTYSKIDKRSLKGQKSLDDEKVEADGGDIANITDVSSSTTISATDNVTSTISSVPSAVTAGAKTESFNFLPSPSISPKTSISNFIHKNLYILPDKIMINLNSNFNAAFGDFNQLQLGETFNASPFKTRFMLNDIKLVNLPVLERVNEYVVEFNQTFEKFEILNHFEIHNIISSVYMLKENKNKDYILLYLILSLTNNQLNVDYFKSALYLLNNEYNLVPEIWLVQCHLLIFNFFKHQNDLDKCYQHLGMAINYFKLCDIDINHEKFAILQKNLAINDTLLSCTLGKSSQFHVGKNDDNFLNLITILNDILNCFYNHYHDVELKVFKIKDFSIELKSWSINYFNHNCKSFDINIDLINLMAIHYLTRPLFLFHILSILNPDNYNQNGTLKNISFNYFISCINSSIYSISIISKSIIGYVEFNLLQQNLQIIYITIKLIEKFNVNYFNVDYLKFLLNVGINCLPLDNNNKFYKFDNIIPFNDFNFQDLKTFEASFINNDIAPTFRKSISYDSYDAKILHKLI